MLTFSINFEAVHPLPPLTDPLWGGIFTPWTKFYWGGTDGGGLNSSGGGFFGDASGSRGSPPSSGNPALRPMAGTSKRLKRRAPSPPTNLFRSLLPPKDSEPNIIVNTKLSPSTSRRFLNYIQTEPQPTRRLRSQDRRFQEL